MRSVMASYQHALLVKRPGERMSALVPTTSLLAERSAGMKRPKFLHFLLLTTLRSYVAALELRIEKLERRLAYARSRKASVAQHESEPLPSKEPDRKDSLATIRAAIHRKAERKRENSDVNSLMSDFGFLYGSIKPLLPQCPSADLSLPDPSAPRHATLSQP